MRELAFIVFLGIILQDDIISDDHLGLSSQ